MSGDEIIHGNMLEMSSRDTIGMAEAVRTRFNGLIETYRRVRGVSLIIPKELRPDHQRVLRLMTRHWRGDMRNSGAELQSLKTFAQWTLDVNCEMRNQKRKFLDCLND